LYLVHILVLYFHVLLDLPLGLINIFLTKSLIHFSSDVTVSKKKEGHTCKDKGGTAT